MYKRADGRWCEKIKDEKGKYHFLYGKTKVELLKKIRNFKFEDEQGPLFKTVADAWWEEKEPELAYNSRHNYVAGMNRAIENFGKIPIRDITAKDIYTHLELMKNQTYAKKTILNQLTVFNSIFAYAGREGIVNTNVSKLVSLPKGLKAVSRKTPDENDIAIIKQHIHEKDMLFPALILYTGLRKGEALALQGKDIDYKNKEIHVTKSVYFDGGGFANIKSTKTENGIRIVPILDVLFEVLPTIKKNQYLFSGDGGTTPIKQWEYNLKIWKQVKAYGIKCTAHQLRHQYATILFEAGLPEKDAQMLLGHADIRFTHQVYTHISEQRKHFEAKTLNEYVSQSNSESKTKKKQ